MIYNRVRDTNTPINKCANPNDVEKMWRERFGLTLSAEERFIDLLLEFENWQYDGVSKAHYSVYLNFSLEMNDYETFHGGYW